LPQKPAAPAEQLPIRQSRNFLRAKHGWLQ